MLNRLRGDDSGIITVKVNPNSSAPTHYEGDRGFKYLEGFPNCGNANVHHYILFALKHLLRLGKKDPVRTELKKAIDYLARAYYMADPTTFNPDDLSVNFKNWD
jgi:hypothetical protein